MVSRTMGPACRLCHAAQMRLLATRQAFRFRLVSYSSLRPGLPVTADAQPETVTARISTVILKTTRSTKLARLAENKCAPSSFRTGSLWGCPATQYSLSRNSLSRSSLSRGSGGRQAELEPGDGRRDLSANEKEVNATAGLEGSFQKTMLKRVILEKQSRGSAAKQRGHRDQLRVPGHRHRRQPGARTGQPPCSTRPGYRQAQGWVGDETSGQAILGIAERDVDGGGEVEEVAKAADGSGHGPAIVAGRV